MGYQSKTSRAELEKFASTCELDPGLPADAQLALRLKYQSALQGYTSPAELFALANELERTGFPQSAACTKQLAVGIASLKG